MFLLYHYQTIVHVLIGEFVFVAIVHFDIIIYIAPTYHKTQTILECTRADDGSIVYCHELLPLSLTVHSQQRKLRIEKCTQAG